MTAKTVARIAVLIEDKAWRRQKRALLLIRRAAHLALAMSPRGAVTILLSNDTHLMEMNSKFRRKKKPTNVLSFPGEAPYLGDIAIAYGVVAREAKAQKKTFAAHAAHLAAHGVLHLLGHDHERARQAAKMEALETAILAELGISDPYAVGQDLA